MGKIKFLNYSNGERFSENYQMLSKFFEKYTGNGLQENWHIGRLDWMLNHDYTNPELLPLIGMWSEDGEVVGVVIFDIDYREYNWKNEDEISIYYSIVANEADIIMGSRQEFDLTERLIQPNMTDEETAKYWQAKNAKVVVIKHGMKGSTAYLNNGESYSIKPFPVKSRKGFGGGDGYASGFLYGIYQEWPMIDCLEFGSAEASMMVRSNNCSDDLPTTEQVQQFIKETKEQYGEMIARI